MTGKKRWVVLNVYDGILQLPIRSHNWWFSPHETMTTTYRSAFNTVWYKTVEAFEKSAPEINWEPFLWRTWKIDFSHHPHHPHHPHIIPSCLVQEDHGLSQVGSSLDDVDDAFRADPWQLLGLGLVEQVVQVAQRLLQFQGLAGQTGARRCRDEAIAGIFWVFQGWDGWNHVKPKGTLGKMVTNKLQWTRVTISRWFSHQNPPW